MHPREEGHRLSNASREKKKFLIDFFFALLPFFCSDVTTGK